MRVLLVFNGYTAYYLASFVNMLQRLFEYISEQPSLQGPRRRPLYAPNTQANHQLEKAIQAVMEGKYSQRQAAKVFGVSQTIISVRMRKWGLEQPSKYI